MNRSSVVLARIPFVWSHCGGLFSPTSLSFYFSTVPSLRCVAFSPQIAHWSACIYSAIATRFVTTATCYNPLYPPPTLHPKRTIISLFHHDLHTVPQRAATKVCCHIAIIRFHQRYWSANFCLDTFMTRGACKTITAALSVALVCLTVLSVF